MPDEEWNLAQSKKNKKKGKKSPSQPPTKPATPTSCNASNLSNSDELTIEALNKKIEQLSLELELLKENTRAKRICAEDNITLSSNSLTSELEKFSRSLHLYDVKNFITLNAETWNTKHSHAPKLADIFGGPQLFQNIIQLPPKKRGNEIHYPCNFIFHSSLARTCGVRFFAASCRLNEIQTPNMAYSFFEYQQLQQNQKALAQVLNDLRLQKKIFAYKINNYGAINTSEGVAPLYSFQMTESSQWTKYTDAKTTVLFENGINCNNANKDEMKALLMDVILMHIEEHSPKSSPPSNTTQEKGQPEEGISLKTPTFKRKANFTPSPPENKRHLPPPPKLKDYINTPTTHHPPPPPPAFISTPTLHYRTSPNAPYHPPLNYAHHFPPFFPPNRTYPTQQQPLTMNNFPTSPRQIYSNSPPVYQTL